MRLARVARVVLMGSAIGVTSTCSHFQVGGVVGAQELQPVLPVVSGSRADRPVDVPATQARGERLALMTGR